MVWLLGCVSALIATGCSPRDEAESATLGADGESRAIPVAVLPVEPRDLARRVSVAGPVEPVRTVVVSSQMTGTVLRLHVEEGDRIQAGGLLAELDGREAAAQLERARAVLVNAESAFERAERLAGNGLITEAELEAARSAHEVAKADVELWSTRVSFTRIAAPTPGIVTVKHIERGAAVSANQPIFEIADMSMLVVRVRVSELDVVHLSPGDDVDVRVDAYPATPIPATIRRIFPAADPQSRLLPVEVALGPRPPGVEVRPGFLARVRFELQRRRGVLAVPARAVGVRTDGAFVYLVDSDTLVRRGVRTGLTTEGWIEVSGGLEPGERVVTSGHTNLRPGTIVRVTQVGPGAAERTEPEGSGER